MPVMKLARELEQRQNGHKVATPRTSCDSFLLATYPPSKNIVNFLFEAMCILLSACGGW